MDGSGLLPAKPAVCRDLLDAYVLEKAIAQLGSELEHRPDRVAVPLTGLAEIMEAGA